MEVKKCLGVCTCRKTRCANSKNGECIKNVAARLCVHAYGWKNRDDSAAEWLGQGEKRVLKGAMIVGRSSAMRPNGRKAGLKGQHGRMRH